MAKPYTYKVTQTEGSKTKVEVTADASEFQKYEEMAYDELAPNVKIPGFRAGKAPKAQIQGRIANDLFSTAVKKLLSNIAAEIIDEEDMNPLTQLNYDLTKASDAGVEFTFEFINYPDVSLGDFSKLKFSPEMIKVEDKEIDEVIGNLFSAKKDNTPEAQVAKGEDTKEEADTKDENKTDKKDEKEIKDLTDEMVVDLEIDGVKTVSELRVHIEARLKEIKQRSADSKELENLIDAAIEASDIPVPEEIVHESAHRQIDEYIARIEGLGGNINVDEFLKAQGKDRDKLHEEKMQSAKKQLERELLMTEIVRKYELMPTPEDIENELNLIQDSETKAQYDTPEGRRYIVSVLIQQRAVEKLKELAKK